jgi:ribonuclease P protein component
VPAAQGFPRDRRLLLGADFRRVFQRPTRSADDYFSTLGRLRPTSAPAPRVARLGLAISRKALPRAVDRNRVKRLVRESFRHCGFPCGLDIVVTARARLRYANNAQIRASIQRHFDRLAHALCGGAEP